jgi:N-acetylneuraminic acid mutarotase
LIVWGGYVYSGFSDETVKGDGFKFDPRSNTWEPIAASPLQGRSVPATVWTGRELLIWGGSQDPDHQSFFEDGAAYDPRTDSWRVLPRAPISARAGLSVWTGRELIVWGTAVRADLPWRAGVADSPPRDGAAYDPETDSWRPISDAPVEMSDATAVWTGREMIVFGAALDGNNRSETETAIGAAYDPATDGWRKLPDSNLSPNASTAAWNGAEMIAWDYLHNTAAYDPRTDSWRNLPSVPLDDYECHPRSVPLGDRVFGNYCGLTALYEPSKDRWRDVSRRGFAGWGFSLVGADPVVLLLGRNVDTQKEIFVAFRPGQGR